jgi:GNAT superfamily N-acetyltransferase
VGDIEKTAGAHTASVVGLEQISAIGTLRRDAYLCAPEFRVLEPVAYEWTAADSRGFALAVWDDSGAPLATMRGIVAAVRADAEADFECTLPDGVGSFPALLLSRAATRADHRSRGLNSLLRYYFIQAVLRCGLCSTLSVFFDGAPRLRLLGRLGYEFATLPDVAWQSVIPRTSPLVGSLSRERMAGASGLLRELLGESLERYPWCGPPVTLTDPNADRADLPSSGIL